MDYKSIAKDVLDIEINGLLEVKAELNDQFNNIVSLILGSKGRLVITGMGKSGLVGRKIVATLASTGTPSFFIHPGDAYHGDLGMITSDDIILAISHSGETDEVIRLLSFFKDNKNTIISMTGNKKSTLALHSDYHLNVSVSKEACPFELAPTTSTTATLALGDALSMALMHGRNFKPENFARFHPGGSLGRKLLVKVKDLMKKENLPIVKLNSTFEEVVSVITRGMLGISVVVDESQRVVGVVTDGDIRRLLQKEKGKAVDFFAQDFYTPNPQTVGEDQRIVEAEKIMQVRKITTLLVISKENNLIGILHLYDM